MRPNLPALGILALLAAGPVAATLKVEVPDLTRLVRHEGDPVPAEQVRRIVDGRAILAAHGARRMPVWGYEFATATASEPDAGAAQAAILVDRLVAHVATLQRGATPARTPVPIAPPAPPPNKAAPPGASASGASTSSASTQKEPPG